MLVLLHTQLAAMAPGSAAPNGDAFHHLSQGFATLIQKLLQRIQAPDRDKTNTPLVTPPKHGPVRVYIEGKEIVVVAHKRYQVRVLRSDSKETITFFPPYGASEQLLFVFPLATPVFPPGP